MPRLVSKEKLEMAKLLVEKNGADLVEDSVLKNLKLGQLEDIEEELGIDLITLFKALTNGIYARFYLENGEPNIIFNTNKFNFINKEHKCFNSYFSPYPIHLYFKDYGKTWALTKSELTNE